MTDIERKRKLNQVHIRNNTLRWLLKKANISGELVGDYAGIKLDELAELDVMDDQEEDEETTDVWDYRWFESVALAKTRVRMATAMHLNDPSDEGAERLKRMCDRVGMSFDEVVAEVSTDPFSSLIAARRNASKRAECIMWLPKFIQDHDNNVHSTVVYTTARNMGFSSSTLERAKRDINSDFNSPCIISSKGVWSVSDEE